MEFDGFDCSKFWEDRNVDISISSKKIEIMLPGNSSQYHVVSIRNRKSFCFLPYPGTAYLCKHPVRFSSIDGVWDVICDQTACEFIAAETDPLEAAKKPRDRAFALDSLDNISVIVVFLAGAVPEESTLDKYLLRDCEQCALQVVILLEQALLCVFSLCYIAIRAIIIDQNNLSAYRPQFECL
jgi:hypothetical protein